FLATHALGVFRISFAGIGPTELRLVLIAGAIAVAVDPWMEMGHSKLLILDVGGVVAVGGLIGTFVLTAVRNARALYVAERLPPMPSAKRPDRRQTTTGNRPSASVRSMT